MHRTTTTCMLVFFILVAAGGCLSSPTAQGTAASGKPSVLLITLDTTRADKLGCFGSTLGLTPSLDAFSQKSVLFDHCEAAIPQTVPSHLTLFSGWNPDRHHLRKNLEIKVPSNVPLLAEAFSSAGYTTGAFVSSFVLLSKFGMGRGFQTYDDGFYDPRNPAIVERRAEETLARAQEWLNTQKGPWFLWIHLYDPHLPYDPPQPFGKKFAKAPYDGEVAYMDACLGRFLKEAEKQGYLAKTITVICGDHGESLGEHGEEAHGIFIYEATTRVPLIIRLPGEEKGRRVSDSFVGLVDIAPTVRGLCGLPPIGGDGVSMEPLLSQKDWQAPPVYMESLEGLYSFGWAPLYGLVVEGRKFILAPRKELYDLMRDPSEEKNLASAKPETAKRLEKSLLGRVRAGKEPKEAAQHLDSEELKSLKSLGYISGTSGSGAASYKDPKDGIGMMHSYQQAAFLRQSGQYAEAAKAYETLRAREPTNSLIYYYLGLCYENLDTAKAASSYKEALKRRSDFPQAYVALTGLLESQGKMAEAYQVAQLGLREAEDAEGMLHTLLAWSAFELGKPDSEVWAALEAGKALGGSENEIGWKLRALMALKQGDLEGSLVAITKMAEVAPPADVALLGGDPRFKQLRADPRFWKLVITARNRERGS